ncbi:unnamed protein product [Ectocarpus fasciculatus]
MSSISGGDIGEIQNVLNRVMLAMDAGDGAAFAACYTPDGTCDVIISGSHKTGTSELVGLAVFLHEKFPTCRHWEGNVCVTETEEGVTNKSYWKAIDGGEIVSTGIHEDILMQIEGKWLIKSRIIKHTWTKAGGHISI